MLTMQTSKKAAPFRSWFSLFMYYPCYKKLTLSSGLPEDLFNLPLKSLDIGYCKKLPLDVIDTICQKMPQLESLDLSGLEMPGEWRRFHVAPILHGLILYVSRSNSLR